MNPHSDTRRQSFDREACRHKGRVECGQRESKPRLIGKNGKTVFHTACETFRTRQGNYRTNSDKLTQFEETGQNCFLDSTPTVSRETLLYFGSHKHVQEIGDHDFPAKISASDNSGQRPPLSRLRRRPRPGHCGYQKQNPAAQLWSRHCPNLPALSVRK